MREIEFRCLGLESKKWHYYNEIDGRINVLPDEPCSESFQYTGLKDKNGKKIYDGCIMWVGALKMQVMWMQQGAGFYLTEILGGYREKLTEYKASHCEISGNISQNPELLK